MGIGGVCGGTGNPALLLLFEIWNYLLRCALGSSN
jgi:hypothetical protein